MPFIGALSGTNLTNMRGDYAGRAYVCITPATIILQARVNITQTGKRATLTYNNVVTGSHTNLRDGMLVLIHETQTDLYNYWFRGRIRGSGSTSSTLNINETDTSAPVNFYVTVIEDYDVFPRLARRANDTNYVDFNTAFQRLAPCISGLQSSYVTHTTSSSASLSFAPTVSAMESGATISTYAWSVADGTITAGSTSTKDITVSFPAWASGGNDGHRWVSLTATDSNSVAHTFWFEVFVGDLTRAGFVLQAVDRINYSATWDNGYNGQIVVHGSAAGLLPNQRVTIAFRDRYSAVTTPMNTSVAMVGRLRADSMTNAGEDYVTETTFTVEGFGTQLANLACPKFACFDKDTPADWGDMIDPSPVRAIWHTVTRFSTFATVCAFDFLSDTNNYQAGIIEIEAQGMLDGINRVAERIMAQITFAPSGEWRLRRHASYLSASDKTGLVTVASLTSRDMLDFTIDRPHLPRVGYVEGGALLYAPATKTYTFYTAKAPSIMNTSGEEIQQVNGLILKSTDVAGATNELSRVVGTHLSRMQNLYRLDVRLYDAWREIVPSNYDWYTFTIATSDNNRGISIGTGRYYLLESASWSVDVATGTLTVQAQFVQDVDAFGTAQDVARVPNVTPYPQQPITLPYGGTYVPEGAGTTYTPTDTPDGNENPIPSTALDPMTGSPDANVSQPIGNEGIYYIPFTGGAINCNFLQVAGAVYTIDIEGKANIGSSTVPEKYFGGDGNWNGYTLEGIEQSPPFAYLPEYDSVNDAIYGAAQTTNNGVGISLTKNLAGANLTSISATFAYNRTRNFSSETSTLKLNGVTVASHTINANGANTFTLSWSGLQSVTNFQLYAFVRNNAAGSAYTLSDGSYMRLIKLQITGLQGEADAFYRDFQKSNPALIFPVNQGLVLEGVSFPTIPAYNDTHKYTVQVTGDSSLTSFTFRYALASYAGVEARFLTLRIRGQGAQ